MSPLFGPAIAIHATAGILALVLAIVVMLRPAAMRLGAVRTVWLALMVVVVVFLSAAVVVGWPSMDLPRRVMDAGLLTLAAYTLLRAVQAALVAGRAAPGWGGRMIDHLGFVAISLFDGFVIVSAIRATLPTWAVIAIGVAGVAAGVAMLNALKRRPAVAAL